MRLTEEELKHLYQEETRSPRRIDCLTADELTRLAAGEIPQDDRDKATHHLAACSDCAEEYRIANSFRSWAQTVAESASDRREAKPPLAAERTPSGLREGRRSFSERVAVLLAPRGLVYAASACLVIVSLALFFWVISLRNENRQMVARLDSEILERDRAFAAANEALEDARRQLEETRGQPGQGDAERIKQYESQIAELKRNVDDLSRPQLNTPIIDLEPRGANRGNTGGDTKTVEIPASTNLFTLILNISGQPRASNYEVEVTDQTGKLVWRGQGLRKGADNTFVLSLSRRLFPAGRYHILLYGLGAQKEKVEDYALQIHYR